MKETGDRPFITGSVTNDITPLYMQLRTALERLVRALDVAGYAPGGCGEALQDAKVALTNCPPKG